MSDLPDHIEDLIHSKVAMRRSNDTKAKAHERHYDVGQGFALAIARETLEDEHA